MTSIDLDVRVPADLHAGAVYGEYATDEIALSGEGIKSLGSMTVGQFEQRVDLMVTYDYAAAPVGTGASGTAHGVDLLQLLESASVGLAVDAGTVTVGGAGGDAVSLTVADLEAAVEPVLLAFSREGVPLVRDVSADGYDTAAGNDGGPVQLVSRLWTVRDVVSVTVSLQAGIWTHAAKPYSAYLTRAFSVSGSEVAGITVLSLADLEELTPVRDSFAASKGLSAYQGVVLRDLIEPHLATGVTTPTRVRVYGADGYLAELPAADVRDGIDSTYQPGRHRDVVLAYAKNGYPLVSAATSAGYVASAFNDDGPVHLVVENTIPSWVKDVRAIVVGEGDPVYVPDQVAAKRVRIISPTAGQTIAYVARGQKLRLRAALSPASSTDVVTWRTSAVRRATVSRTGVVTATRVGRVRVTARSTSGKTDVITLVVTRKRAAASVSLPGRKVLKVGQASTLFARLGPAHATSLLTWRSSARAVVTVDRSGRVVARRQGIAVITVTTANGLRSVCRVVVRRG